MKSFDEMQLSLCSAVGGFPKRTVAGGNGIATSGPGVLVAARTFSRPWPAAKFLFQTFCVIVIFCAFRY